MFQQTHPSYTVKSSTDVQGHNTTLMSMLQCLNSSKCYCSSTVHAVEEPSREAGYAPLKVKQLEAIEVFVSSKDTCVALPTGYEYVYKLGGR